MPAARKIAERLLTPQLEIPDVIQQLAGEIRSLLNDTLIERQRLVGIGFALSAFVDAAQSGLRTVGAAGLASGAAS